MIHRTPSRHAGVLLLEVMFSLALTATLILMLAISMGTYRRSMRRLAYRRAAIHLAEQTLTQMEEGGPAITNTERIKIRLVAPTEGTAPAGNQWAEVSVSYEGGAAVLTGLIASHLEKKP